MSGDGIFTGNRRSGIAIGFLVGFLVGFQSDIKLLPGNGR
jgi:hypothetical protein